MPEAFRVRCSAPDPAFLPASSGNAQLYGITDEQAAESRGYHGPVRDADEHSHTTQYPPAVRAVITGEGQHIFTEWNVCMKGAGFDYANSRKANNDPEFVSGEPTPKEITVAVADVRCKKQVNLINVWGTVRTAYEWRALERYAVVLAVIKKNLEIQEKNAATLLTGG